jgi:hypothetical protein
MRDQHMPNGNAKLQPSATYASNLVRGDRRIHGKRLTLREHQR